MTREKAKRSLGGAVQRSKAAARKFERDEITEAEFWATLEAEENLRIFAITGNRA